MIIPERMVKSFVEEPYYSRGRICFRAGAIRIISCGDTIAQAKVLGTRLYNVTIRVVAGRLTGTCSCPAFDDFGPCKHIAGTCFALMASQQKKPSYKVAEDVVIYMDKFGYLEGLLKKRKKQELIDFLVSLSAECPEVLEWATDYSDD